MLQIRPNCELCDRALAPDSNEARICSYECTFCADCVDLVLENVCPNCGGGFEKRPVRPSGERRDGVSLAHQPASTVAVHSPYSEDELRKFTDAVKGIPPEQR